MPPTTPLPAVSLKPDFQAAVDRFDAWWQGEVLDRPAVSLSVRARNPAGLPDKSHASHRERWFDLEYRLERAIAGLEVREFLGETLPIICANMGPEITSTLLGCELDFSENTSWSKPIVESADQWSQVVDRPADFGNEYWQAIERFTAMAIERCEGRCLVGMTDLHGAYDLLCGLREPEDLCLDMIDAPELVDAAARHAADVFVASFQRSYRQIAEAGFGSTCWTPAYHHGPAYVPSCDFWCMINEQMAREFVLPTIRREMQPLQRSVFHLDGPQALRHLDLLLAMPDLDAVQWVFGAGNGPARKWIDVYQRCRAAGKAVQVLAEDVDDALAVLEAVGPDGLWLCVGEAFDDRASAEAFLAATARRPR